MLALTQFWIFRSLDRLFPPSVVDASCLSTLVAFTLVRVELGRDFFMFRLIEKNLIAQEEANTRNIKRRFCAQILGPLFNLSRAK